jgi:type II secretory pathway component GspD/PulD (secretin)
LLLVVIIDASETPVAVSQTSLKEIEAFYENKLMEKHSFEYQDQDLRDIIFDLSRRLNININISGKKDKNGITIKMEKVSLKVFLDEILADCNFEYVIIVSKLASGIYIFPTEKKSITIPG